MGLGDDLAAMPDNQNATARFHGLRDEACHKDGFARAGGRDYENAALACRDLGIDARNDLALIAPQCRPGHGARRSSGVSLSQARQVRAWLIRFSIGMPAIRRGSARKLSSRACNASTSLVETASVMGGRTTPGFCSRSARI